jgi:hypothetical protein
MAAATAEGEVEDVWLLVDVGAAAEAIGVVGGRGEEIRLRRVEDGSQFYCSVDSIVDVTQLLSVTSLDSVPFASQAERRLD